MPSILVIEDDRHLRETMKLALGLAGYRVSVAENGKQGLEVDETFCADVVITDITMPEMDGFEVIQAMLSKHAEPRIIAMSGAATEAQRLDRLRAARQIGALWTLRKPFDDVALINAVELALANPAAAKPDRDSAPESPKAGNRGPRARKSRKRP